MKRIAWLFLAVLCSVVLAQAQSSGNAMELHGTICRSSCVTQVNGVATCDTDCTDTRGDAVLVDDQGRVQKISDSSQAMCESHIGKHVKVKAAPSETEKQIPSEQERENTLRIEELTNDTGGG